MVFSCLCARSCHGLQHQLGDRRRDACSKQLKACSKSQFERPDLTGLNEAVLPDCCVGHAYLKLLPCTRMLTLTCCVGTHDQTKLGRSAQCSLPDISYLMFSSAGHLLAAADDAAVDSLFAERLWVLLASVAKSGKEFGKAYINIRNEPLPFRLIWLSILSKASYCRISSCGHG